MPDMAYVFMGDYVDRGYYSLESFTTFLVLKVREQKKLIVLYFCVSFFSFFPKGAIPGQDNIASRQSRVSSDYTSVWILR
jgi:hypothetical protein